MAVHPEDQFTDVKSKVIQGIEQAFPVSGAKKTLVAKNVRIDDSKGLGDFQSQLDSKNLGRTWAVPVMADLQLVDRSSGRVLDTKKNAKIADLPRITDRFSYIVKGNEYQVDNIWRRKPGVYSRIKENGDLQAEYNLAKGKNFELIFDPKNRKFNIGYENSTIPLYPVLKSMGVSDSSIEKRWGKEILEANKKVNSSLAIKKFNKVLGGSASDSPQESVARIANTFNTTELSKETTQTTLGKSHPKVTADTLFSPRTSSSTSPGARPSPMTGTPCSSRPSTDWVIFSTRESRREVVGSPGRSATTWTARTRPWTATSRSWTSTM